MYVFSHPFPAALVSRTGPRALQGDLGLVTVEPSLCADSSPWDLCRPLVLDALICADVRAPPAHPLVSTNTVGSGLQVVVPMKALRLHNWDASVTNQIYAFSCLQKHC